MICEMCKKELVTEAHYVILNKSYCYRCAEKIHEGDLNHK